MQTALQRERSTLGEEQNLGAIAMELFTALSLLLGLSVCHTLLSRMTSKRIIWDEADPRGEGRERHNMGHTVNSTA